MSEPSSPLLDETECDFCGSHGSDVELKPAFGGSPLAVKPMLCEICRSLYSVSAWTNEFEPDGTQIARDIAVSTRMILRAIKDAS